MRKFIWVVLLFMSGLPSAWADTRFEISGDVVYDTHTNLIWARCSVGLHWKEDHCTGTIGKFSFLEAQAQGGNGWRVPTRNELFTLVDPTRSSFPTINAEVFPDMSALCPWYWTSTPNGESVAWYVDFENGYTGGYISMSSPFSVRLVRNM